MQEGFLFFHDKTMLECSRGGGGGTSGKMVREQWVVELVERYMW
jgi:hypothetical protein